MTRSDWLEVSAKIATDWKKAHEAYTGALTFKQYWKLMDLSSRKYAAYYGNAGKISKNKRILELAEVAKQAFKRRQCFVATWGPGPEQ